VARKLTPEDVRRYAEFALEEAKRGDPAYLISRVATGKKLTDGEIEFIAKALMATAGRRYARVNRGGKQARIAEQVVTLVGDGTKQEAAVHAVMCQHGWSRRQVFKALKVYKGWAVKRAEELAEAREYGYDEEKHCPVCGQLTLRRNGIRMECDTCGETTE
jgi:hypothetical protein